MSTVDSKSDPSTEESRTYTSLSLGVAGVTDRDPNDGTEPAEG